MSDRPPRTDGGRLWLDRAKLKVPFLGPVLHRFGITEFCRSLATLLTGGIPLVPALEIATDAVGNLQVRRSIAPQIQLVREGKPFHDAEADEHESPCLPEGHPRPIARAKRR